MRERGGLDPGEPARGGPVWDVAIIGAGLAGLSAAWHLAEAGVERLVVVAPLPSSLGQAPAQEIGSATLALEPALEPAPEAALESAPEPAVGALLDHPSRVAEAVGIDDTAAIWRYADSGLDTLAALAAAAGCPAPRAGALLLATFPVEAAELAASAPLLGRFGIDAALVDAPLDGTSGHPRGLAALRLAGARIVDTGALAAGLASRLAARGIAFVTASAAGIRVHGDQVEIAVEPDPSAEALPAAKAISAAESVAAPEAAAAAEPARGAASRSIAAEIAVIACGAAAGRLHPVLAPHLFPIRVQGFRAPLGGGLAAPAPLAEPVSASWGHELYLCEGGAFVAHGMRPDSQAGDVGFAAAPTDAFQGFLRRFARERVPGLPDPLEARPFAGTIGLPRDGLPHLGALPGTDRILVATGFGFRGAALAAAGGRSVARLIAGAGADYPPLLGARRFA